MDYAKYVKNIRKKLGITQEQLAERIGVKRTTVGNYEIGVIKPSTDVFVKLQALDSDR
ncbi:MAG: helix-turn-helix transcriptional regulator [Candidatus Zixiibacteriota bacterium]|nr:MAG: helix-turn-helix transcriptional regulator [candidate division Zixibacteria bacterium]